MSIILGLTKNEGSLHKYKILYYLKEQFLTKYFYYTIFKNGGYYFIKCF